MALEDLTTEDDELGKPVSKDLVPEKDRKEVEEACMGAFKNICSTLKVEVGDEEKRFNQFVEQVNAAKKGLNPKQWAVPNDTTTGAAETLYADLEVNLSQKVLDECKWDVTALGNLRNGSEGLVQAYLSTKFKSAQEAEDAAKQLMQELAKPFNKVRNDFEETRIKRRTKLSQKAEEHANTAKYKSNGSQVPYKSNLAYYSRQAYTLVSGIDEILARTSRMEAHDLDQFDFVKSKIYRDVLEPYINVHSHFQTKRKNEGIR